MMSKQKRAGHTAVNIAPHVYPGATYEPEVAINWPYGHADIRETSDDVEECFVITIHGVDHYLHATTVYERLCCKKSEEKKLSVSSPLKRS